MTSQAGDNVELEFHDAPPSPWPTGPARPYEDITRQLQANPGLWAKVATEPDRAAATRWRQALVRRGADVTLRGRAGHDVEVWASWPQTDSPQTAPPVDRH